MTADFLELVIYLLQFLADPKGQVDGKPDSRRLTPWSPWLIAFNVVVGVGALGLVGHWSLMGESRYPTLALFGLVLGAGCLGLAAWMADETDRAVSQSSPAETSQIPKQIPSSAGDEL